MASSKLNILFLCTANSCRSQMAEGWAEKLKSDCIDAYSAGTNPGVVSSRATEVMRETGVDITHHCSKHIDDLAGIDFDYVITLCGNANENCPVFPGKTKVIHRGFEDPASRIGTQKQIMDEFRKIRDQIREFVETLPESLDGEKDG